MQKCRECGVDKVRILSPTATHKNRAVDDTGKVWNGHQCPTCRYKVQTHTLTHRRCKGCKENLPAANYFYHDACRPKAWAETQDDGNTYYL